MNVWLRFFLRARVGLAAMLALAACGVDEEPETSPSVRFPRIVTTFYPTTYFARRIAGPLADVACMTPPDEDPATWQPSRAALAQLLEADLLVLNGASFERWADTASLSIERTVHSAAGFRKQWRRYDAAVKHTHGPAGDHDHEGIDGHTWLNPLQATEQARAILRALVSCLPEHEATLRKNFDTLAADLAALDQAFAALGALPDGHALYAEHPAYGYLATRYGWRVVPLDAGERRSGRLLLWEGEASANVAGLTNVTFDPCEQESDDGDYLARMKANLERIRPAFDKN